MKVMHVMAGAPQGGAENIFLECALALAEAFAHPTPPSHSISDPPNPDPEGFDQSQTWRAPEIHLDDGNLVLETT